MGRKKKDNAIGNSIIKDRFGHRKTKTSESFLHTSELQDGAEWGRLNLQSITEQSNLDDFLATAELAGTEFTAERLNVQIVDNGQRHSGLPTAEQIKQTQAAEEENRRFLQIPRRPQWDETTTAEELNLAERTSFLEWRRQLAQLQDNEHLILTPFERNLDFWRQLWRVVERSDVVVQIVDARNPLLFRCEDLEAYVKEIADDKVNVLLINKADLLSETQREKWASYFNTVGLKAVFWSAVEETERCKKDQEEETESDEEEEDSDDDDDDNDDDDKDINEGSGKEEGDEEGDNENLADCSITNPAQHSMPHSEHNKDAGTEKETDSDSQPTPSRLVEASMATSPTRDVADSEPGMDCGANSKDSNQSEAGGEKTEKEAITDDVGSQRTEDGAGKIVLNNNPKLLTGEELISFLTSLHKGPTYTEGVTTIGLVGYPNVGKSSSINAILQSKKVPVSATPGRTKHFQTLYVDKTVLLCDCPGLVMPTFVSTKADMVVSGILPIDQMRDYVPPTSLVCRHIPRHVFETTYGIILPPPEEDDDPNRPPTALELLSAYGYMRGFMTHKGVPDFARSARHILKDYMNGKLLYAHPPPGLTPEEFVSAAPAQKVVRVSVADHSGQSKKTIEPQFTNSIDRQFFAKAEVRMGTKGVKGAPGASLGPGVMATGKKHFKKGKKEKLRRIHGHADY